jgi:glycosyltransferase involved in cell wall biosynthesis
LRLAYCLTHPIQYQSPLIRHLVAGGIDLEVIYGSDATSRAFHDQEFGCTVSWDLPLLDGHPHSVLNSNPPSGSTAAQTQRFRSQLQRHLNAQPATALWVHGWHHPFTRAVWQLARQLRLPLLVRGETFLDCVQGGAMRRLAHRMVFTLRFRQPAAFLAVGSLNRSLYRAYGVPSHKIFSMPYAVDNAFFQARAAEAHPVRAAFRAKLNISEDQPVILFCGKLIPKKDPETLLRAFAALSVPPSPTNGQAPVLLFVGDGELRPHLESLAAHLAPGRVQFVGFQNQTALPAFYDACDLFVIPSLFEPWGLVVYEVMNAAKPVLASDRVGSAADLIIPGQNGNIFPAGDVNELTATLQRLLADRNNLGRLGLASLARINTWSFDQDLVGMRQAVSTLAP